ncbi:MAG: hypothetical protein IPJ65_07265 [Archangiaceae bacterium]|nr:hypothetical protein [Archangiaceae bacterium]
MDFSLRFLADAAGAQSAFKDMGTAATAAAAIIKDFAADSVRSFAEAERVQKQLARAAGENTAAFESMAAQMSAQFAVEDESIKRLQTLALSYGMLPQQIEDATRATLDYAAATGRDANEAMMQLIRGVEAGHGTLGRMGISFETTGNQARDMTNAIAALNRKFGGAGAADADTLDGRARSASIAMGELKETVGGFFDLIERKTGVLDKVTGYLRGLTAAMQLASEGNFKAAAVAYMAGNEAMTGGLSIGPGAGPAVKPGTAAGGLADFGVGDISIIGYEGKGGALKQQADFEAYLNQENEYLEKKWLLEMKDGEQGEKHAAERETIARHEIDVEAQKSIDLMKEIEKSNNLIEDGFAQSQADYAKDLQKLGAMQFDMMKDQTDEMKSELQRRSEDWRFAGVEIGTALVNGIFSVIAAAQNKKSDTGMAGAMAAQGVMKMLFSVFGYGWAWDAGMGAANAYGAGGDWGGAIGTFAGGVGQNVRFSAPTQHTGGWIQRYHDGGWGLGRDEVPAILQSGERVLSRREVDRMGGARGVEHAAQGGGARSITIQAFDSTSILNFFGDQGGSAMLNASRVNAGPLRLMFGKE